MTAISHGIDKDLGKIYFHILRKDFKLHAVNRHGSRLYTQLKGEFANADIYEDISIGYSSEVEAIAGEANFRKLLEG